MKLVLGLIFATLCVFSQTQGAEFEDCSGDHDLGQWTQVTISNCGSEDDRCILQRNANVSITMNFQTNKEIKTVKQVVHGQIAGVKVPFPLPNPDACSGTGLECPMVVGTHTYNYELYVKPSYPKLAVTVIWELLNEDNKQIVCVTIPSKLN